MDLTRLQQHFLDSNASTKRYGRLETRPRKSNGWCERAHDKGYKTLLLINYVFKDKSNAS
jgi:hypothetical protein